MTNMNIDDIKRELMENDFTKEEVEAMTATEAVQAWMELPLMI